MYPRMMLRMASLVINLVTVIGILGGYDIDIREAPFQVNYGDICGGVIIHKQWVLTVAHCGSESYFIRTGSRYRLEGAPVKIKRHFVHPLYRDRHTFDYDVQLLELDDELEFGRTVKSIDISDGDIGKFIYVSGWGYSWEKGDYRNVLQQVRMDLVSMEKCQKIENSWYNHTLTSRMFCAGDSLADACQGDSGGAAVSYNRLVGVSSFGYGCGRDVPGVYINVSSHNIRIWIRRYTGIH